MKRILLIALTLIASVVPAAQAGGTRVYNPTRGPKPCDWSPYSANVGINQGWNENDIDFEGDLFCEGIPGIRQEAVRLDLRYAGTLYHQHGWQIIETQIDQASHGHTGFNIADVYSHVFPAANYDGCADGCNLYDVQATYYVWHAGRLHTTTVNTITIGLPYHP